MLHNLIVFRTKLGLSTEELNMGIVDLIASEKNE
jgi:hypothetical protein